MTIDDCRGNPVTAANPEAVGHLDAAVRSYLGLRSDPGDHLKKALAADPGLLLGHVLRGCFMLLFANRKLLAKAREAHDNAVAAARAGATEREHGHLSALAAWLAGDTATALKRWDAILVDHPRDVLALKLAEYWTFYGGDPWAMLGVVSRPLHAWDDAVPDYGFVLGMRAFALEESGDYAAAETSGRRAVELNPEDVWSTHAVAHVFEMTGRHKDGIAWLEGLSSRWGSINNFIHHVWWHLALLHHELGAFDAVLDLYDRKLRPARAWEYLDLTNAAALLLRLEMEGVDVGDRWQEIAEASAERTGDQLLAFADVHYAIALAAAGAPGAAERFVAGLGAAPLEGAARQVEVHETCGRALGEAVVAARTREFARAVDLLLPLRPLVKAIGGSHAQRDLFEQVLIHAAVAAGRLPLARALLSERTARRPRSPLAWKAYAGVLDALDESVAASRARKQAAELVA
jgi:tetratricopeptide (TPR) repeat protein